jgi:glutaminyl-tRNA synthetase
VVISHAKLEPSLRDVKAGDYLQFLRSGYFMADSKDHSEGHPVFQPHRPLKDSWRKEIREKQG